MWNSSISLFHSALKGKSICDACRFHRWWHHQCGHLWPIPISFIVYITRFPSSLPNFIILPLLPPYTRGTGQMSGLCSRIKIEETRITLSDAGFDLNPHRLGILHKQNAHFVICDAWQLNLAIQHQSGVIPVKAVRSINPPTGQLTLRRGGQRWAQPAGRAISYFMVKSVSVIRQSVKG